jgi:lysophospholipase L1-like esterase
MKIIFGLGDSITYGAWGQQTHGWATLLREWLDGQTPYPGYYFYSLGIPGETSAGLRNRFEQEMEARKRSDDESFVYFVACGANDATWLNGEQRFKQTTEQYADNMRYILSVIKEKPGKFYVLNTTPVNEEFSTEFGGKDKACLNKYVDKYNDVLTNICNELGVSLVDINSTFKANDIASLLTPDGLHPNDNGHQLIFETIKTLAIN